MQRKIVLLTIILICSYFVVVKWVRPYVLTTSFVLSDDYQSKVDSWNELKFTQEATILIGNSLVKNYEPRLSNEEVIKLAIGGDCLEGLTHRLSCLESKSFKRVVINMGINDIVHGFGFKLSKLKTFISELRHSHSNIEVYIMSINPENLEPGFFTKPVRIQNEIIQANAEIKGYCNASTIGYINVYDELSENNKLKKKYSIDGIHLTEDGYKCWDEVLTRTFSSTP